MSFSLEWLVIRVLGTKKTVHSRGVFKGRPLLFSRVSWKLLWNIELDRAQENVQQKQNQKAICVTIARVDYNGLGHSL